MSLKRCACCGKAGYFEVETCCASCRAALAIRRPREPRRAAPLTITVPARRKPAQPLSVATPAAAAARVGGFMAILRRLGLAR